MALAAESVAEENQRLRRCISDLVGVLALPAMWTGNDPAQIGQTLIDALFTMLELDLAFIRFSIAGVPTERLRLAPNLDGGTVSALWQRMMSADPGGGPPRLAGLNLAPFRLGVHGELGILVAGAQREGFPRDTERLLLGVAANQAAMALREAQVVTELDRRVTEEVEERHRAEEALQTSTRDVRLIVDSIPGLVAILTPTGAVDIVNQHLMDYFGQTLEELRGWGTSGVVHPDDVPHVADVFTRSIATGSPYEIIQRFRRHDGVYRWFLNGGLPLRDASGRIIHWYILLTDIDERTRAEEALRRSEAFLAEGQRISGTGTFSWQLATDDIRWSEELYRIFELPLGALVTLDLIGSRLHPDDRPLLESFIARARSQGGDLEDEHRYVMPNGTVKYVHLVAHATRDRNGQVEYIGAAQDVTERRNSEETLGKVRSELAHVARVMTLGVLTASIAHEVNQPLAGIVTNASTCLRFLAAEPPNLDGARETARRTIRDGTRASEVITRLRALFAKKSSAFEAVDLNEATREVIALSTLDLQRDRVLLRTELADNLPPVAGDRVQLQQVILNLLRNATDAMREVDDRPRHLLIRTEHESDDGVRLSVQDAGVGLEPRGSEKLFEPFFTTKGEGMGIGLSVSRSIIESHNGHLWAEKNDGPGATFGFSVPAGRAS